MFEKFKQNFPDPQSVLDVGVTSESVAPEANYFEEMFPHKDRITAVGVERANHLEVKYPGLKFIQVNEGQRLPFKDSEFSVAFSNAVIEHVVDVQERLLFLKELVRVSQAVFLTTPNKYFWIEPHTGVPFLHFVWPGLFNKLLDAKIISKFYNTKNLRLFTYGELKELADKMGAPYQIDHVRFWGIKSNLILTLRKPQH